MVCASIEWKFQSPGIGPKKEEWCHFPLPFLSISNKKNGKRSGWRRPRLLSFPTSSLPLLWLSPIIYYVSTASHSGASNRKGRERWPVPSISSTEEAGKGGRMAGFYWTTSSFHGCYYVSNSLVKICFSSILICPSPVFWQASFHSLVSRVEKWPSLRWA